MKCRVCDSELPESASICPNCGRMVVSFPEPLPEALQDCLEKERAFYERQLADGGELQHELGERKAKIDELNGTVASLKEELEKRQREIKVLDEAKYNLEREHSNLENKFAEKVRKCEEAEKKVQVLEKEKAMLFYEICSICHSPYGKNDKFCKKCSNKRPEEPTG